jgi:uncharacterized protein with NAD-binding domain and iron-sulfur cluster
MPTPSGGISRRRFLRDAGAVAAGASALTIPDVSNAYGRRRKRRQRVAIFGGGIAGLTAAHELAERGFDVRVFDRDDDWGGRVRGGNFRGTASGGRRPLPGEHGIHIFFGSNRNLDDTMRRIPFESNPGGVYDNLVATSEGGFARIGKQPVVLPLRPLHAETLTPELVLKVVAGLTGTDLAPDGVAYFANRLVVHLSSCGARRRGQWEETTWGDFIAADRYPGDYKKVLGGITRHLWACRTELASADFTASTFERVFLYGLLGRGTDGAAAFRVLNGPCKDTFLDPWIAALHKLGVRTHLRCNLEGLSMEGGRIAAAHIRTPHGNRTVEADWYVCALHLAQARRLWSRPILSAAPSLRTMEKLGDSDIVGAQYYLRQNRPVVRGGVGCVDSPWVVEFFNQAQYWTKDFAATYGDGRAHDCLSAAAVNVGERGLVNGKKIEDCTAEQFARELWEEMKLHLNVPGEPPGLTDDMLLSWRLGDGTIRRRGKLIANTPHSTALVGTARYRPAATTAIPNLMLCGDYLDGEHGVGYTEAANHNGRRAANAVLDAAGSLNERARTMAPYDAPEWEPFKKIDEDLYRRGLPNLFDTQLATEKLSALLGGGAPA